MPALKMIITDAGLDALVDAQNGETEQITIAEMGLSNQPFVMSPTLVSIPNEFKRMDAISGESISDNIIHLTAIDISEDDYDVTGFGLFLDDGTLFAAFSSDDAPVITKSSLANALFSHDIAFTDQTAANITFGNAIFSYPPATEAIPGVAVFATEQKADEGVDDDSIMTPALVQRIVAAAMPAGVISLWSGEISNIPNGWSLCDGQNNTPDLRDRFVIGAGGDVNVNDTGGTDTHNHNAVVQGHMLTEAEMPVHRHMSVVDGISNNALTAANSISEERTAGGDTQYQLNSSPAEPNIGRSGAAGQGQEHSHGITLDDETMLPPYFALAYIIKI